MKKKSNNTIFNIFSNKIFLVLILMVFVSAVSFAVGFTMSGTPIEGAFPVYSGSGDTWTASGTTDSGLIIDGNTVCFPTSSSQCDNNISWDGTDLRLNN